MAAVLLLRGIDPHHRLTMTDPVEAALHDKAFQRMDEFRRGELDYLARRIGEAIGGK